MKEDLSLRGIWFLPSKPEARVAGFLKYTSAKGIELQLMGLLEDGFDGTHKPDLINGISEDGKRISLYRNFRLQRGFNSNSYETSTYDSLYMFIGKHFSSIEELKFEKISFDLADFDEWVGDFGFNKIESNDETRKIIIEYERPEDLEFQITETINFAIRFNAKYPIGKKRSKATITQTTGVNIWSNAGPTTFGELFEWFQGFYRFMTLAYFKSPLINNLSVGVKKALDDKEYVTSIKTYFQADITKDNYKNIKSKNHFLFTYREVKFNFRSILKNWFTIENILEPTVAGLTEAFMKRAQPVEFKFLGLSQAIETFHRRTTAEASYNNEQHKEKLVTIFNSIQEEYKNWLKEKLQYSHEPSLKARLKQLTEAIPEPIKTILFKPTVAKFLNQIRDSRNYYTHYNTDLRDRALKGPELFTLSERMKIFLICLVLKEIGFTEKEVVQTILGKGVFIFNHIIKYDEAKDFYKEWSKSNDDDSPGEITDQ